MTMKTYLDLKQSVQKSSTAKQAAGIFVDDVSSIIENNSEDPSSLKNFARELRGNKDTLVESLTSAHR